jgi:DNA-binding XRE family transcriptional regulator
VKDREILRCLGKNIQAARLRAGLTQECLAELVGIHWKTLSGIERGLYPCAVTNFIRIAQHLRVSTDSLLAGIDPPEPKRAASIQKAMARKRRPKAV